MNRTAPRRTSYGSWIAATLVVLGAVAAAVYLVRRATHPLPYSATLPSRLPVTQPAQPASAASIVQYPIAQTSAGPAPAATASSLPSLADSDASVREALRNLVQGGPLGPLLQSQIIWRVVATVDVLPRQDTGSADILPLRTPKGVMQIEQINGASVIAAANAGRYATYMTVLAHVDPYALVAWYKHNYRLFQEAYRELGYPRAYFNDRLVRAIEDMLAAPSAQGPIAVARSGAHYHFVDPQLQSLSNGQKLMLRLGPRNEAQFKKKLRTIRELLTGQQMAH